jgi:hypothetical protein
VIKQPFADDFSCLHRTPISARRRSWPHQPHDFVGADACHGPQHDLGTPDVFLRVVTICHYRFLAGTIGGADVNENAGAQAGAARMKPISPG